MTGRRKGARLSLVAAMPWAAVSACFGTNDTTLPEELQIAFGSIAVMAVTTGTSPDPDGYRVKLDEARSARITVNGAVSFDDLPPGGYQVHLEEVAVHCTVTGANPIVIVLQAETTREVRFDVTC